MNNLDATLDYAFGWRWLLPKPKPGSPGVVIADKPSVAFLQSTLALAPQGLTDEAPQLAIIDANFVVMNPKVLALDTILGASTFAVYGTNGAVERVAEQLKLDHLELRDYGLIPPRSPRIVVPLGDRASTLSGLGLHRPGRKLAKLAMMALKALVWFGFVRPLKQSRLLIASRTPAPAASSESIEEIASLGQNFALYLGVVGSVRKTVALPVGDAASDCIIKSAELPPARDKLDNEARILAYLGGTDLAPNVPRLISYRNNGTSAVLVQQYFRDKLPLASNNDRALTSFLKSAARISEGTSISLGNYLDERLSPTSATNEFLSGDRNDVLVRLINDLRTRFSEIEIPLGLTHGDFAPWNYGKIGGNLAVYDWEEARLDGIPMSDAFSQVVLPDVLVRGLRDPVRIASGALEFASRVYHGFLTPDQIGACFILWCLGRLNGDFPGLFLDMADVTLHDKT